MVYRPTPKTEARKAEQRQRIVGAARHLVERDGFAGAQVARVAEASGVATGTVYRYFPSKTELFVEVFREASGREVEVMASVGAGPGPVTKRLAEAVRVFLERAFRGRRLAYALVAEPVDPGIEAERLVFREAYTRVLADLLREGIDGQQITCRDPDVAAACLVGALGQALVTPLSPTRRADQAGVIDAIVDFCLRAVSMSSSPQREDPADAHS